MSNCRLRNGFIIELSKFKKLKNYLAFFLNYLKNKNIKISKNSRIFCYDSF